MFNLGQQFNTFQTKEGKKELKEEKAKEGEIGINDKADALKKFSAENGSPILEVIDPGENFKFKKSGIDLRNLKKIKNKEEMKVLEFLWNFSKEYCNAPVFTFTEDFKKEKDNELRKNWEEKNQESMKEKNISKYYNSNRLNWENCVGVIYFLDLLEANLKEMEKGDRDFSRFLGRFLINKQKLFPELEAKDDNGYFKYDSLEDAKKIELVQRLTDLTKKAINFLEK